MPIVKQIIEANIEYAKAHELLHIGPRPARRLIVLTCMDTRLSIRALGLKPGDAHILRNAGGTVTEDVLRSIIVSHHFFGTQSVIVINHTDCGMLRFNDRELREALRQKHGADAAVPAEFHSFTDIERNLREQMQKFQRRAAEVMNKPGGNGPLRAGAAHAYAYWLSFIGNVLGTAGHTSGWTYNCIGGPNSIPNNCIWELGYVDISPQGYDPHTVATAIQDGNYDYLTNAINWASNDTAHTLPNSLYLSGKPAFFNAGKGYTWPWVNPTGSPQLYTLPAKARYDAGTPFTQP